MRSAKWQGKRNPGHSRRLALWRQLEAEFGEPLPDIIIGLREQGNSWRTVAGALGVSQDTLIEWRKALGLPIDPSSQVYDPSSFAAPTPTDARAKALGYSDAACAIADMRLKGMTLKEIGVRLGVHPVYVGALSPPHVKGIQNSGRHVHTAHLKHVRRGGREHAWSKDNEHVFAGRQTP